MKKSSTNHEKIMKKSLKILQKSWKNKEKTCFPLQPEAHFLKDNISENKGKTKAQLLTRRVPTQVCKDTLPTNADDIRSQPLRRVESKRQATDKEKSECPRTKMCLALQREAHFSKTRT